MSTWVQDIVLSLEKLGGVSTLSEIYKEVEKIRNPPLPKDIGASVRGTIEAHSSDSKVFKGKDLFYSVEGLGRGVWGLRSQLKFTPVASDIKEPVEKIESKGNHRPDRVKTETYRILRDTSLARQIKLLHKNSCQFCSLQIDLGNGNYYSEAHHIKPLGNPHNGPDVAENIIVLCPNHHALLDYFSIPLDLEQLIKHDQHSIGSEYVDYHNENYRLKFQQTD